MKRSSLDVFDVAIVGGGPAGSTCAAVCATAGLETLLLERETFPREKVCGDCLNPACWPILARLALVDVIRNLPHGILDRVEFIGIGGQSVAVKFPGEGEIAIKRSLFDQALLNRARELGAVIMEGATVTALSSPNSDSMNWTITTGDQTYQARTLVAADGRNSTVARICNLLPRSARERVALQTHLPLPTDFGNRVVLQFLPEGYAGQAPVGEGQLNLCLVGPPKKIERLRAWAEARFQIANDHGWRTITPLTRAPIAVAQRSLFLIGDAAQVVEPFTGEGIYYAIATGTLAADAIVARSHGQDEVRTAMAYVAAHAELYRGRLWINRLARAAALSPQIASTLLQVVRLQPALLRLLTNRVVGLGA
jgi:geranylgeranyl reductase family protein